MNAKFSPLVQREVSLIRKRDKKLIARIKKQIQIFEQNPKHPSLRLHKLTGGLNNTWSISINRSVRMVYRILDKDTAYFVDVGTHDEVYGK